jgi:AcrR family transcriptional regulator
MPRNKQKTTHTKIKRKKGPSGKIKLADAMRELLGKKDFYSISTDEIATIAQINEALIYRYFGDKRGLMHHVLADYLEDTQHRIIEDLNGVKGSINKLKVIIKDTFEAYCTQRVFAKIILIEVRNFPGYFESDTFQLVRQYAQLIVDTIAEGMEAGEIRNDVPAEAIRNLIIGGIEHLMLPSLIFDRDVQSDALFESLFEVILSGIAAPPKTEIPLVKKEAFHSN